MEQFTSLQGMIGQLYEQSQRYGLPPKPDATVLAVPTITVTPAKPKLGKYSGYDVPPEKLEDWKTLRAHRYSPDEIAEMLHLQKLEQ